MKNLQITINGFNGPRNYQTKEVSLRLKLNKSNHDLKAIVIPSINTKFVVQKLPAIVKSFKAKGFTLVDSKLTMNSSVVEDIDFILGANDAHVLWEDQK